MAPQQTKRLIFKSLQLLTTTALTLVTPLFVVAQVNNPQAFCRLIDRVSSIFGSILLVVAVLVIIIGAFYLVFGGGSEDAAKKGKNFVIYGLVGVAVALLAFSLPTLVSSILNLNPPFTGC